MINLKKINLYILIVLILLLSGCRSQKKQELKLQKKEKAPSTLVNVAKDIQEILSTLEEVEKLMDGTYLDEKSLREEEEKKAHDSRSHQGSGSQGNSQGGSEESKGQGESQSQEGQSQGMKKTLEEKNKEEEEKRQEKITKSWQEMSKKIESIHKNWNSYEAEEKKGNISVDKIDQLRTSINNLTKSIEEKDIMKTYEYGSQSLLNISPMFDLYKDDLGGEVNRIMHGVYFAYLRFIEDKASQGINVLKQLENYINNMKLKIGDDEDKIKIVDRISAAIEEMEKAMKDNSLKLIRIKRDVIIDNLEELEK